ncbi:MAG: PAS domain-containing protein, partial [Thermoanaerobaculia bacterium]|nr:PAS domain-containing protein [Thermoanaerobaculia bacterium]
MAERSDAPEHGGVAQSSERERLLAMVTDSMLDMVTQIDAEFRYVWLSPSVERIMGLDPRAEVGRDARERVHPEDLPDLLAAVTAAIAAHAATLRYEYRYRHGRGHFVWSEFLGRLFFDADGNFAGAVIGSRDISLQRAAQDAIRESRARMLAVFDHLPEVVWLKDWEGRYLAANRALVRACGAADIEAVLGKTDAELWPRALAEKFRAEDEL